MEVFFIKEMVKYNDNQGGQRLRAFGVLRASNLCVHISY